MYAWTAFFIGISVLCAQPRPSGSKAAAPVDTTAGSKASSRSDSEIAALKQTIAALSKRIEDLELKSLSRETFEQHIAMPVLTSFNLRANAETDLNLTESTYSTVTDTSGLGRFLIMVEKVEPYLDGSRVTLQIGNTLAVNLTKLTFELSWNRRRPEPSQAAEYLKWVRSIQTKEFSEASLVVRAQWNKITAFLPATKPEDLGYLAIKNLSFGSATFQ